MASGLCAALTGRTHGCTDQPANVKKSLANSEPSPHGTKRRFAASDRLGRFSNRPSGSSTFQAIHHSSVDVAHGLALLFGLGTKALPSWGFEDEVEQSIGRPCRQCDGGSKRTCELTSSIVPRGTSFHHWVELDFLLSHLILYRSQAAATSLVHRNSVPSTHMRCMITANRRASATIAFFIPRCLAIFIAQAFSQDHFAEPTRRCASLESPCPISA